MGLKLVIAAAVLTAAAVCTTSGVVPLGTTSGVVPLNAMERLPRSLQKTTRDKIYAKDQADRGAQLYVKHCERCHTPEKVPEGKKPGPPVVGEKFMATWTDRTLGELFDTINNTMPSDGTAVLTVDQSLDSLAYILRLNGFPEGAPLKNDDAMKAIVIVK
jgi:mono/diheme cytochrome c family protein